MELTMPKPTIKIKLVRSPINRPRDQRETLKGLGLTRMQQTVERPNTREIRGMVKKVIHLVRVEE
jgi:large subunit ribosomal protein L30